MDETKKKTEGPNCITLSNNRNYSIIYNIPLVQSENHIIKECIAPGRKTWREPLYNNIVNLTSGFRAIYDNIIDIHNSDYDKQIIDIFDKFLNINNLNIVTSRKKTYSGNEPIDTLWKYSDSYSEIDRWSNIHSDYYENSNYLFTAILFLEYDDHLIGGETGFVDNIIIENKHLKVLEGLVVEPKIGRLILFTCGENYHAPLRVYSGTRTAYHIWFNLKK
jgi:hypothetical protein